MHSDNFNLKNPTNKFIYILPYRLKNRHDLTDKYLVEPFLEKGGNLIDLTLLYLSPTDKENAAYYKKQISLITKLLKATQTPYVYVMNSQIFSRMTGVTSPTRYYGLPLKSQLEGSEDTLCFIGVNPEQALTSNTLAKGLTKSVKKFTGSLNESVEAFKPQVIKSSQFIFTFDEAVKKLQEYFKLPIISVDIETKSLKHNRTGIETISFAKSPHEAFAISVDRNEPAVAKKINALLKAFFQTYRGKYIWHGGKFDRKIITNCYFTFDNNPMLSSKQHEDTMVMAYCCENSVEKPLYGLKELAFEFSGDYGIDVKDTTKQDINELLNYNNIDSCSTFYLYNKYKDVLIEEQQDEIYRQLFLPSLNTLIKTELHGIPVCPKETKKFIKFITADQDKSIDQIRGLKLAEEFTEDLKKKHCDKRNAKLKTKVVLITDEECDDIVFNPNSPIQLQDLLFKKLGLPVLSKTKTGQPSTDKDTLKYLLSHTEKETEVYKIVEALGELSKCKTIISTFIPILEEAITKNLKDGVGYIYGNFNIPGTISGRLSSSEPNLQNMPSTGTKYAKAFKKCLICPEGYVIVAIDYDSLEDRISAKTTQDPNKLKVYQEGFDGHSLRAYYYYPDQIPRVDVTPANIDKITKDFPELRQDSKPITFALTYLGMYLTLMDNCGLSMEEAKRIEANYHELYEVSDAYVKAKLDQAAIDGFVTGAFGFKLRAEILKRVLINDKKTPNKIQAYLRTLGNMLGQSYGLLNSRAANEVFDECFKQEIHNDVFPIAQIHDSQYFIVKDEPKIIYSLCTILDKAISWDDLPELQQDDVPLSGTPQLSFNSWAELEDIKYSNYEEFLEIYTEMKAA